MVVARQLRARDAARWAEDTQPGDLHRPTGPHRTGRIIHRDPEDDSGYYIPGGDPSAAAPQVQDQR